MADLPGAFLECRRCHAIVDFSSSLPDDARILCGKCGYDLGRHKDVKDAAARALRQRTIDNIKKAIKD